MKPEDKIWNEAFKIGVRQCMEVVNRMNTIDSFQKNKLKKRMLDLIKRIRASEPKVKLHEVE